jgi:vesicle-associated membrane protein 7
MAILFAVIARGTTVLAQYASCAGNFVEVTDQVLAKISPENNKLTYSHGNYLFHYIADGGIVYLCITDNDIERAVAFSYLAEIKRRFQTQYGLRVGTALPYAMNSEFSRVLAAQMQHANSQSPSVASTNRIDQVRSEVEEIRGIMVQNIDNIANRGERLELLVDKTEDLSNSSVTFRKSSRNLARSMWWKNVKITVIIIIVVILVIYFIVSIACGGLAWQKCVKKS